MIYLVINKIEYYSNHSASVSIGSSLISIYFLENHHFFTSIYYSCVTIFLCLGVQQQMQMKYGSSKATTLSIQYDDPGITTEI